MVNDARLNRQFLETGDVDAFTRLFKKYYPTVYAYVDRMIWKGTFFPQYNVDALDSLNTDRNATPISDPEYISNDTDPNSSTNTERFKEIQPSRDERNRPSPTETEITPEGLLRLTELEPDFEKQFMTEISEFMSTEGIKTQLPKQFTSERLTHLLQTLERYGPEDGIYHLKETDPEIAQQVENFLKDKRSQAHD